MTHSKSVTALTRAQHLVYIATIDAFKQHKCPVTIAEIHEETSASVSLRHVYKCMDALIEGGLVWTYGVYKPEGALHGRHPMTYLPCGTAMIFSGVYGEWCEWAEWGGLK